MATFVLLLGVLQGASLRLRSPTRLPGPPGAVLAGYSSRVLMPGVWSARVNSTNSESSSRWTLWPGRR